LKTNYATSRRLSMPSRSVIPDDGLDRSTDKSLEPSKLKAAIGTAIKGDIFSWKGSGDSHDDRHEVDRNNTPNPTSGGRALFKSGRLGLFGKDKPEK